MKISHSRSRGCFFALIAAGLSLQTMVCLAQNLGFEDGMTGWTPTPADAAAGLSTVVPAAAHTGQNGLQVKQAETGPGSWIQSPKIPIEAKNASLKFWARCLQPSGVGVWVNFFDADGHNIAVADSNAMTVQIPQNTTEWTEFNLDLKIPVATASVSFSVHAYSKHSCLADFDDFSIVTSDASTPAK